LEPRSHFLQTLHATAGNHHTGRWVQTKLKIGSPNDEYEREADRVADQVMRMPASEDGLAQHGFSSAGPATLQRRCACAGGTPCSKCDEEEKGLVQRRTESTSDPAGMLVPDSFLQNLGSGHALDAGTQSFFETRFGHDFSQVRVHTDANAGDSARSLHAQAYTVGRNIVMASGQYAPDTSSGQRLLAHELTHVVQQNASSRLPARAARTPSLAAITGMIQRQADVSALPPAMPCVTIQSPGHPAGADLMFGFLDTTLNAAHVTAVTTFHTAWVAAGSSTQIAVDGFASTGGPQQDNWQRSCDRPQSVKTKLVALGVPASKITTFAHGESTEYGPAKAPNDRAVIYTTGGLAASDLRIDSARQGGDADAIFFDRGSSTVSEPSQLGKITPLATANSGNDLTLFGYVSEDENVPAATGTALANARINAVSTKLGAAGHAKSRTPDLTQTGFGAGQISYRDMRKVVAKVAGGSSGQSNCGAGSLIACSPVANFTSAQKRAADPGGMLDKATKALTPPISPATNALLQDRFGATPANEASIANIVRTNLATLMPHITTQMAPVSTLWPAPDFTPSPGHRCANSCDGLCGGGASAYNNARDAAATMTLCDTPTGFIKEADLDKRAGTLIHEGLHGITLQVGPIAPAAGPPVTAPGAKDFAYHEQRLIKFLDPLTALKNNDSYVVLVFQILGLPIKIGHPTAGPGADVVTAGAIPPGQRQEVDRALAWLEGWLVLTRQEVSSLYNTIKESIPAGSWNNSYYKTTMTLLAPRFGMTMPPSLPTPAEQFEVAAIHERLARMRGVLFNTAGLSIDRVTPGPTSWAAGPTFTVIIGDDFFALPAAGKPRAQLDLLLRAIVTATTGVSGDAVPRYIDLVNQIRIHRGVGGP